MLYESKLNTIGIQRCTNPWIHTMLRLEKSLKTLNHTMFASYTIDLYNIESQCCMNPNYTTLKANVVQINEFIQCSFSTLYDTMVYDTTMTESLYCTTVVSYTVALYNIKNSMLYEAIWYSTTLIRVQHCAMLPCTMSTVLPREKSISGNDSFFYDRLEPNIIKLILG